MLVLFFGGMIIGCAGSAHNIHLKLIPPPPDMEMVDLGNNTLLGMPLIDLSREEYFNKVNIS